MPLCQTAWDSCLSRAIAVKAVGGFAFSLFFLVAVNLTLFCVLHSLPSPFCHFIISLTVVSSGHRDCGKSGVQEWLHLWTLPWRHRGSTVVFSPSTSTACSLGCDSVRGRVQKWVINLKSLPSLPPQGLGCLSECLNTYLKNKALYIPQGLWEAWGSMDSWHSLD